MSKLADTKRLAKNWEESAAQMSRNADFYHDIVRQVGNLFGVDARTSDDGSVQDDVLALKVPELVQALREAGDKLAAAAQPFAVGKMTVGDWADLKTALAEWQALRGRAGAREGEGV